MLGIMTLTPIKSDTAAGWHWAVIALVCGVFVCIGTVAALLKSWSAVAIALAGLGVFGKSALKRYRLRCAGSSPITVPLDEKHANSLNLRIVLLVCALGLLLPLYFIFSSGKSTLEDLAQIWPLFLILWVVGMFIASVAVFLYRYAARHVAQGVYEGRSGDA
jgi:hypothetical protein